MVKRKWGRIVNIGTGAAKTPAEVRMWKGKGAPEYWAAVVRPGRVLFEVDGVDDDIAKEALRLASQKLPVKTKFIVKRDYKTEVK